jgi:hypothetical protein
MNVAKAKGTVDPTPVFLRARTLTFALGLLLLAYGPAAFAKETAVKEDPAELSVQIEADRIAIEADHSPILGILKILGEHFEFTIERTHADDPVPEISGRRTGRLVDILEWLLTRQNYVLLYDRNDDGSVGDLPKLAGILLMRAQGDGEAGWPGSPDIVYGDVATGSPLGAGGGSVGGSDRIPMDLGLTPEELEGTVAGMLSVVALAQTVPAVAPEPEFDTTGGTPFFTPETPSFGVEELSIQETLWLTTQIASQNLESLMSALEQAESQLGLEAAR